jgi:hypothetical protein
MVKRGASEEPGPAPFIDQFGHPVYENRFSRFPPNPALDAAEQRADAPFAGAELTAPNAPMPGSESRSRHLTADSRAVLPPPPEPQPSHEIQSRPAPRPVPEPAPERVAELHRLLGEVGSAAATAYASSSGTRAERLANQLAERRARARTRMRRGGSIAAAGVAVFGVTAAYGFWTGGADAGSRVVKATMLPVSAEAVAGTPDSPLTPGARGDVELRIDNPNGFVVTLKGVAGGPFPSEVHGDPGCTITTAEVIFVPPRFLNVHIPPQQTALVVLPGAAQMGRGSSRGCIGHTFTIPVAVTVQK